MSLKGGGKLCTNVCIYGRRVLITSDMAFRLFFDFSNRGIGCGINVVVEIDLICVLDWLRYVNGAVTSIRFVIDV